MTQPWHIGADGNGHTFDIVSVDLRCNVNEHRKIKCECIGELMYQTLCSSCAVHFIAANENEAVEAWHDHAWPGWRELPAIPAKLSTQGTNGRWPPKTVSWWQDNYPVDLQTPGAPIITTPASNDSRESTSQDNESDRRQAARQARRAVTSERIAMLLWRRKMTIADLGRAIGVERSTISLKLHTKRRWYLDGLEDIAEVLATSVAHGQRRAY